MWDSGADRLCTPSFNTGFARKQGLSRHTELTGMGHEFPDFARSGHK